MSRVGRYAKATAKPGMGHDLAARLVEVAEGLRATPGCELYVVNRVPDDPDVVWVTELWSSQEALDASLQSEDAKAGIPEVLAMVESFDRIDLEPVGGVGLEPPAAPGHTLVHLREAEDMAAKAGYGEMGEARFVADDLDAERTGVSLQSLRPDTRQMFAHRHHRAEEVVVVLQGSGRAHVDDVVELQAMDALRIGAEHTRRLEAGPEGLEFLVVGARVLGDAEVVKD